MPVKPGSIVIDDSNYKKYCLDPTVGKGGMKRGLKPRNWKKYPCGSMKGIPKASISKIPRTEWSARIKEINEQNALFSDMWQVGNFGSEIPVLDQNGYGYCWAHSTVSCALMLRAQQNQPFEDLSPYAIACKIKNFQDRGGWNKESVDFMMKNGCPTSKKWPQRGTSRSYDNSGTWEEAAQYKIVEIAEDVEEGDFDMQMTYALLGIPGPLDLNWWGHSIGQADPVEIEPNHFGLDILNSWGRGWGRNGWGVLSESKARNNGFIALRTGTIAA